MKNVFCITAVLTWLLILFPAFQVSAGFSLPDDAYRMSELKNATENAIKDDWPLAFVLSNENTTCGLATNATIAVFNVLSEDCIIVYVHASDTEMNKLPKIVYKGLTSKESGRYVPITVIVNAEMNHVIDIVLYGTGQAYINRLRHAVEKLSIELTFFENMKYKLMSLIE